MTRTQWFSTYSASLMNTGGALSGVTATVTSLTPSVQVIPGQGILHFKPVPANGTVPSSDTFTILVDRDLPFDFANLRWSFLNPVANAGANQSATVGSTVTLNGSASSNPSGIGTLAYSWTLAAKPAGSNAVLVNANGVMASITVDIPGNYIASLTVSNGPKSDSAVTTVSTVNSPPVARAGPNQTTAVGATVALSGSGSSDVDGDPLSYFWTLVSRPAGSSTFVSGFRSVSASLVADKPGAYVVQLVVNDGKVDSTPSTVLVTSGNTPPVANAGLGQAVSAGSFVQLNGSGSTDVDGDPLVYTWSLITVPAGSTAHLSSTSAVNPTFIADVAGTYVAQLIVNDGSVDSVPSTVTITTNASSAPTANAGPNQTVARGATATLSGSGSDLQGRPLTFLWSLITTPVGSVAVLSNSRSQTTSFVADKPGTYVAQLIVNNGSLDSAPSTVTVTTLNTPPVANAGSNRAVTPGATVVLDGSGSSDADNDPLSYSWSFTSRPPGSNLPLLAPTSTSPVFVADIAGTYVVQLIVNDGFANSNPATVTITASDVQSITLSPQTLTLAGGATQNLTLILSGPAPAGGLTFNITSSNSGAATVASSTVTILANLTTATVPVTGVAAGSSVIRASTSGLADATANVTVTASARIILPAPLTVAPGDSAPFPVSLAAPAPSALFVQLTSSDPSIAALSATGVNFNAGEIQPTRQPTITGVAVGIAGITAAASGFAPATSQVTVGLGVTLSPPSLSLGASSDGTLTLTLSGAAQGNITFALSSSNPGAAIVPQVARFSPGMSVISFKVTGVAPGSTIIKASALGFPDVTANVTVQSPGTLSLSASTAMVQLGQTATVFATLSQPAAGATTVNLTSSDTSRATISPSSIVIPQGSTTGSIQVTGVNVGSSTIGAAAQGYTPTSLVMQVGATIAWVNPNVTITGNGQQIIVDLRLFATVPGSSTFSILDGLAVNVTSSNPDVAITPSHVNFFWDGSSIPTVRVQVTSVRPGTTILHANGTNIPDVTMTVTVNALIAAEPSGPASMAVAGGSPQSATVNTSFADTLKVLVKDFSNNPVSGATVTFATPTTGPSGLFAGGVTTAVTDANGIATSTVFTANGSTGSYVVTATLGALSASFALTNTAGAGVPQLPAPVSVSPAFGSGMSQTFTYTFRHPGGVDKLTVLNILISKFLDGRQNCYLAYIPSGLTSGTLLLVNDGGAAGGPFSALSVPGSGSINNSQCTINGAGSSVTGSGDTLTLTLAASFNPNFMGDKVVYMAARDTTSNNSGWQALGAWEVPGPAQAGPVVTGVSPGRTSNAVNQAYTFTFTDSFGFQDLSVLNVLVNSFLDGRNACYVAYVPTGPTSGSVYLVNDAGDAGGPFQAMTIPGSGFVHNSQCTINAAGSSASANGTTLSLTLAMTFADTFAGNQVLYAAARSDRQTSDWHAKGTVTVLGTPWIGPASMTASFSPPNLTLAGAETRNLTVTLSGPAPAAGVTLNLVSTNAGVATVSPSTITIPFNTTSTVVQVKGITAGAAVIRASADISIAVDLSPATANVTVNNSAVNVILPGPMTLQPGQIVEYPVSLSGPAGPNGLFVILSTSDPSKVGLSPNSGDSQILFFPAGSTLPERRTPSLYAFSYGSATITATGDGFQVVSQTVQVGSTASFSPQSATINGGQSQNLTLSLSGATPAGGLTFNVISSNPAIAILSSSTVTIPGNTTTATVRVTGGSGGSAVITASAVGSVNMTATANITVNAAATTDIVLPGPLTLQPGQVAPFSLHLSAPAGPGGVFITLTSSDPTKVALTSTQGGTILVFFPAGSTDPDRRPPDLYGINFGSATITATGDGIQSFSQTIQVTATLNFADASFTTRMNGRENRLALNLSAPAPAGGLTVNLNSSDPGVASVPATTFISAGSTTGTVPVTSVGVGSATIHASALPYVPDATLSVAIIP